MKRFRSLALSLATLITILSASPAAHALTIDEFNDLASTTVNTTKKTDSDATASLSAIGGFRNIFLSHTDGPVGSKADNYSDTMLFHSQGSGVRALAILTWDGDNNALPSATKYNGLNAVNLSQDGADKFLLKVYSFDYANAKNLDLILRLYDPKDSTGNKYSEVKVTLDRKIDDTSSFTLEIPFSHFYTLGANTIPAPFDNSKSDDLKNAFATNTVFALLNTSPITTDTSGNLLVGAIQLYINGQLGDSDISLEFVRTNGLCVAVPKEDGKVIDDCGICLGTTGYEVKDDCGYCPNDTVNYENYTQTKDSCLNCKNLPTYIAPDLCNRCPVINPNYGAPKDPCGVCDGNGSSCNDCSLRPQNIDRCGVCDGDGTTCLDCDGVPFGGKTIDECGDCGGTVKDPALCDVNVQCTTVEASAEILTFEKRLVEQATTIKKKFDGEKSRNKRNKCGINVKPSEQKVKKAYQTIKNVGNDIFTKGVEICGEGCVTVSYADQVKALMPTLKVIEKQTKSLANKVKKCYQKKKIKTTSSVAGVVTTINDVQSELNQLIQDCKDKQVCK